MNDGVTAEATAAVTGEATAEWTADAVVVVVVEDLAVDFPDRS